MRLLKAILGYSWAVLMIPVLLVTFIGMSPLAETFVNATGLKISPWYTGGEVVTTLNHEQYQTIIHRAVFDGLFARRKQGFVQINLKATRDKLPDLIKEAIDYDQDGTVDFQIELNTENNQATLAGRNPGVLKIEEVTNLDDERAVRVLLQNRF